ncbi:MAG: glutamine amidotransferase family protein [bacterium]|nr:glutamine amidotransferase family protein [bacterium]
MLSHQFEKSISGGGLFGVINKTGKRIPGEVPLSSMCSMIERGNGLGAGFAAYGIYPNYPNHYAFHVRYHNEECKRFTEQYLDQHFIVDLAEPIPTTPVRTITNAPNMFRYFLIPKRHRDENISEEDYIVNAVMEINVNSNGAYVFSSGKNMGAFKGVGHPHEIGKFFRIQDYAAYIWTAHTRFPTNTPGWWGGAHPFTLLDWSIVHNGEISSYGINKRFLEMYGYKCTLMTDTEVMAYLFDLLLRRMKLPLTAAFSAVASPFWKDIDRMPEEQQKVMKAIRMTFGPALVNGPFAILFGSNKWLIGMNDRIKLRPFIVGIKGEYTYMASEESAIREVEPDLDKVWAPHAGYPVVVFVDEQQLKLQANSTIRKPRAKTRKRTSPVKV